MVKSEKKDLEKNLSQNNNTNDKSKGVEKTSDSKNFLITERVPDSATFPGGSIL